MTTSLQIGTLQSTLGSERSTIIPTEIILQFTSNNNETCSSTRLHISDILMEQDILYRWYGQKPELWAVEWSVMCPWNIQIKLQGRKSDSEMQKYLNKTCFRYYACHYGPVGNYIGQQIYSPGSPCSRCPYQTQCSNSYQGLCHDNNNQKTNFR